MEQSQGYPIKEGYPQYIRMHDHTKLEFQNRYSSGHCEYVCYQGAWTLLAMYNQDRHLVISHRSRWPLCNSAGKYLTPLTKEQYNEPIRQTEGYRTSL